MCGEKKVYGENYPRPVPDIENGEEVYIKPHAFLQGDKIDS